MKRLAIATLLLATVLVQVTWAPRLTVAGVFPNLALVAVIAITWTAGPRKGMAWACVAGLLLDLTAPGPLGPHAVALLAGAGGRGGAIGRPIPWPRPHRHRPCPTPG